jgi:outer membrane receptor for ferrienterochelin and colicins
MFATALAAVVTAAAQAQTVPATAAPASGPAAAAARPASAPQAQLERVEITGRGSDTEQRRRSTAAKIIVGRDEIEKYGDSTVGELLKRLPGVTMQGAPGRGGNIRMRGLGGGYTQILLDNERVPPGFSLDSLQPEQIERIEILRAPTAETGARAIAGTINIITREGFRKRINDLRVGSGFEAGHVQPGLSWTRNQAIGDWTVNLSLSAFRQERENQSTTLSTDTELTTGAVTREQREHSASLERRGGVHLTSRLQWRDEQGSALTLMPFLIHSAGRTHRESRFEIPEFDPDNPSQPLYDHALSDSEGSFTMLRLNGQWNRRVFGNTRWELRGGIGQSRSSNRVQRREFDANEAQTRLLDDSTEVRDSSLSLSNKLSKLLDNEHSLVGGVELEATRRQERRDTRQTTPARGSETLNAGFGEDLQAGTTRFAAYGQDEWNLSPSWSAHAGLRYEQIATRGDGESGSVVRNRSQVWTPLAHAVWKPDPKSRDQVRFSLTRSYRAPTLANLIARPSINSRFPVPCGAPTCSNRLQNPDRAGNPDLKPELATGIDIAIERYLSEGGLLSANLFHRAISRYIRNLTALETVSWSPNNPRYVSRPQNVGDAITQGIELEAKFRASDVWADVPAIDLRANASFFRSRVKSVPGPDNRLDQQPSATANLGADYRFRGTPLKVGGNFNWNPAYSTRLSEDQSAYQGAKRVLDAYLLWTFNPELQLRVSGSNLTALDHVTGGSFDVGTLRQSSETTAKSYLNLQVRLEIKL